MEFEKLLLLVGKFLLYSEFVFCGRALKLYGLFGLFPVYGVLFRKLVLVGVGLLPEG